MPQHEIVLLLKQHKGKKWTTSELAERLDCNKWSVSTSLVQLIKFEIIRSEVEREPYRYERNGKEQGCVRDIRRVWL